METKTALVTGAGRGIGKAIALALAAEGYQIVVNYNGSEEAANEVVALCEEKGVKAMVYRCNVADYAAVEQMMNDVVKEMGSIDVLVNNSGITKDGLLLRMKEEDFDRVVEVNLKGCFNCIRHVARIMMKQRHGSIINMSSVVGLSGNIGQANYAASKAGIIGLTKSTAKELAARGIRVNAIAPGFVETEMTKVLSEEARQAAMSMIAMKRFASTDDIADLAVFLASDKSSYITGQVISVDGGMAM